MTFNPSVPNAGQSPGLFPPQNSTNFARLKTIINADHVFNDTAQDTDGVHRQVTYISRDPPVSLPLTGTNSMLYSWQDADGRAQLRFYNGTLDYQITPIVAAPTKITGIISVAGNSNSTALFTVPTNTYGTIFLNYTTPDAGNAIGLYYFYRSGPFVVGAKTSSSGTNPPTLTFINTYDIAAVNNTSSVKNIAYYIIVESIP